MGVIVTKNTDGVSDACPAASGLASVLPQSKRHSNEHEHED